MDDANLTKLQVSPGTLSPKFNKDVTEYSITVASDVEKVNFSCMTSDSGASYQILGSGGSKSIAVKSGDVTVIKIEVTSEDGTTKLYQVNAKRLSAKDASLTSLQLSVGVLEPEFAIDNLSYACVVPFYASSVTVKAVAPDKKNVVKVCGGDPSAAISLNVGETPIEIAVTSADGSNTGVYKVAVTRKQLTRAVRFVDNQKAAKYECPICLGPFYCPISIKGSEPKHVFCAPCISELTRTSKFDPLDETPLELEWKVPESGLDKEMSSAMVHSLYAYAGAEEKVKYGELGTHAKESSHKPKLDKEENGESCGDCSRKIPKGEMEWHKAKLCTAKHTNRDTKHSAQVRGWEKKMQQVLGESSVDKLVKNAQDLLKKYKQNLPTHGRAGSHEEGQSPLDFLTTASHNLASAIKVKGKDGELHYQLGLVLEEQYYAADMYGLKKEKDDMEDSFAALNVGSKHESTEEEDIRALCQQRGVGANAPLSRILQAIDEELRYLKDSGQSAKADYVQTLYMLKSKEATQGGKTAQAASSEETSLGQAHLKFMDAVSVSQNNAVYNLHAGRLLLLQGKVEDALQRLEVAVGLKPCLPIARFYLGLAIASQPNGAGSRTKEAITYLNDGVEYMLEQCTLAANADKDNKDSPSLHSEDVWRSSNVQLLRGIVECGKLLSKSPQEKCLTPEEMFHSAAKIAAHNICTLVSRGDIYQSMEWVLLDSHSALLELMLAKKADPGQIAERCQRLSALIKSSTVPQSVQILQLQQKTCETGVIIQPCNSRSLYLLGNAQLAMHENEPTSEKGKRALEDAQLSFRASIELEGKPGAGDPPPQLAKQQWWVDRIKKEEEEKKAAEEKAKAAQAPAKGTAAAPARGGAAARGGPAARGGAAARGGRGGAAAGRGAPAARGGAARGGAAKGGAAARGAPAARGGAARGGAAAAKPAAGKAAAPAKQPAAAPPKADAKSPEPPKEEAKPKAESKPVPANVPLNKMSHLARLGLARVLVKDPSSAEEGHMLYQDVITMAPGVHDAYIELGELLVKTDPLKAVDVYAKFPFPEGEPSFDDAYIHGEIVRLLMKKEQFDDPRLEKYMIAWGRVMGIGALEKYVDILDSKFKSKLLMNVYAGVNNKSPDDSDMQAFFKFKMWL